LNVVVFARSGVFGMKGLHRCLASAVAPATPHDPAEHVGPPPGPSAPRRGIAPVFLVWMVLFGIVGAQMSWVLRPFIGSPDAAFTWFRPRRSSFFEAVLHALWSALGG
jgi:hypothetical protein